MSHATVMILRKPTTRKTIRDLLEPYDENLEVAPHISKTKAELIEDCKGYFDRRRTDEDIKDIIDNNLSEAEWITKHGSTFSDAEQNKKKYEYRCNLAKRIIAHEAGLLTDEDYHKYMVEGDEESLDADGNLLSTYNPDAKWDWYEIGGRWSGLLILKNGERVDQAKAKDIDWDAMFKLDPEEEKLSREFWKHYVLGEPVPEDASKALKEKIKWSFYKKEYYLERYKDEETYIRHLGLFSTFAVITPNGVWHEAGTMGWFGCSSASTDEEARWTEEFKSRFIDTLTPDTEVTIVDYHI